MSDITVVVEALFEDCLVVLNLVLDDLATVLVWLPEDVVVVEAIFEDCVVVLNLVLDKVATVLILLLDNIVLVVVGIRLDDVAVVLGKLLRMMLDDVSVIVTTLDDVAVVLRLLLPDVVEMTSTVLLVLVGLIEITVAEDIGAATTTAPQTLGFGEATTSEVFM